jgi:hypothetical protein
MSAGNSVNGVLAAQLDAAAGLLGIVMADVTPEVASWKPAGLANPIGTTYAHVVAGCDAFVNGTMRGGAPLFASSFAGRTGLSELPPDPPVPGSAEFAAYPAEAHAWAHRATVDLDAARAYAEAVFASIREWLAELPEGALDAPFDLSFLGVGMSTVGFVVHDVILAHVAAHAGEIAALKGLQGLRGYPF